MGSRAERRVETFSAVQRLGHYLLPAILLGFLILVWYGAVSLFKIPWYEWPTPWQVLQAIGGHGWSYLPDAWTTAQEILAGFGLAVLLGLPLAALISEVHAARLALYPVLIASQIVPLFAIAAIITIVLQSALLPQIAVTALYSFFPIVVTGADGLSRVDPELVQLLKSAGASRWRIFRTVRVGSALPAIFSGAKLGVIFAVSGAAISEWIGGQSGLGYLMRFQNDEFNVPGVFGAAAILTLLGVALFGCLSLIEFFALPWNRDGRTDLGDLWRAGR